MPIYKNKGVVYNIPDDKRAEYEQANPAAKIMVNVQGDITSLPPQAAKQYADMGIVSMVDRAGWAAHKKHRDSNPLSEEEAGKAKQRIMTALQGGNVVTPSLTSMGQDMARPRPLVPKAEVGEVEKVDVTSIVEPDGKEPNETSSPTDRIRYAEDMYKVEAPDMITPMKEEEKAEQQPIMSPRVDGIRYAEDMYKVDAPDVVKPMGERASKFYDIDAEVGEAEKAYNKAYREALSEETDKPQTFTQKFQEAMRMQDMGAVGGTNAELAAEKRPEVQQAYATYKLLDDAREIQEQAKRNTRGETGFITNALYALKDNVFDPEQWDMGVKNAGMEVALQHVVEKSEKNMPLTESEDRLLEASITNMMVQQAYADMVGRGYAAGKVTAESLPFMLEMLANPVSGVGKGLAKGIARAALKEYGKKALKTIGGKVARGIVATGGNVVSAAGMTATTGVPRVVGDAARRIREGKATGTAFSKAFGANVIESLTEMLGWQMAGAGKAVRGGIAKITPRKVTEIVDKVQSNDLVSAVSNVIGKAGWQGLPEEYLEEVAGTVLNSRFVGDSSLADLTDIDQQINTFLGVSILGGAIAGAKTAAYIPAARATIKAKSKVKSAEQVLDSLMTDDVAEIKTQIDNATVEDMGQAVMAAITSPAVNAEQKMALVSYAGAVAKIKAMEAGKDKQRAEGTRTPERDVIEQSYEQGAEAQGTDKHTYELEYQKVVKDLGLTDEQIDELDAIEDPATYIYENPDRADELSRYYTAKARRDGMVDEAETRIQQAEDSAGAAVDDITHTDGNVYRATLASGEEVTISRGKVVIGDDGDIDKTTSDARYVVRTQDGAVRMVGAEDIKSVTSVRSGAEEKTATMEEAREAATRQEEDEIDGVNTWQIGVPMAVVYVNGERGTLAIESIDGDTYTAVNEAGERVVMSREDIVDAVNRAEIDPAAIEIGTMGTAVIGGKEVDVTVSGEVDADGNVPVDIYNADGNVVGMRSIPVDSFKPIQSRKSEPKDQQQTQQEETPQEPTSQVGDEAAETEQAPVIPTDKKGRKLYEDVPVDVTINELMTVLGTEDVVREVVADTIEGLNEDLQKEQSKGKSSDINETIATKQRIAELQRKISYWTGVQQAMTTPVEENVEEPEVAPEEQGAEPIVEDTIEEPVAEVPEAEGETPTEGIEESETLSVVDTEALQLRMSEEEFNNLLQNGTIEELQEYKNELNGILEIKEGGIWSKSMEIDAEYRKAVEQYGSADAVPQDVIEGLKQRKQPYTNLSNEIYRRIYALGDEIDAREVAKSNEQTQREQEGKETHRKDAYNGFMADMTAVKAGQVDKALSKKINIDGTVATIAEHIERWDKDGTLATSTSEVNKYKGVSRRAYNRMDAAQQRAEDERVKNGGTKTEYYVNDYSLGKTAYDYAQYLLSKKESQPTEQNAHNDYLANNPHLTKEQIEQSALLAGVFPYPFDEDAEWMNEGFGNLFEVMQEKVEENNVVLYQVANEVLSNTTEAQKLATEAVLTALDKAGVEVIEATPEMVDAIMNESGAEMYLKQKSAPETASVQEEHQPTVVSSTDGAKVLKEIDFAIDEYEEKNNTPKTFIGDTAKAIGAKQQGSNSQYATFEAANGKIVTIRLADHNAKVSTFDNHREKEGISIVISAKGNGGINNDGTGHIVEYFYDAIKLRKAEGKPLVEILKSIKQALYSGEYKDNTGLAERQEVNAEIPQFHRVYHGSGTLFDEFDHSFIGTGEGHQAFGWGTYVTEVRSIGESYARKLSKPVFLYKGERVDTESFSSPYRVMADLYHATNGKLTEMRAMAKKYASSSREFGSEAADLWDDVLSILNETRRGDIKISKGKVLYTVEIPNDIDGNYIEYDASVGEDIVEKVGAEMESKYGFKFSHKMEGNGAMVYEKDGEKVVLNPKASGADLYEELSDALGGAKEASSFLSEVGFTGISYQAEHLSGGRADGAKNYVIFNEKDLQIKDVVEMMRTPQGTVYGWTVGGKIYLTPAGMNANTPIHEYTHLWANAMMQKNPRGWESVKNLLKGTPVWDAVMTDEAYADIRSNEDLVASEVLSRISGRENARKMEAEAQKMIDGANGVVGKANAVTLLSRIKEALQKFWNWVGKDLFGIESFDSIEEVTDRVLYDLLSGTDLKRGVAAERRRQYVISRKAGREIYREDDIEIVNEQFNEDLRALTEDNANNIVLNVGIPSDILLSAGVEDKPMKLYGNKVISKMKKHGFSLSELKDLPKAVADPIAVFEGSVDDSTAVLTELKFGGKNVLVSISLGKNNDIDFNVVSSVYGKNSRGVLNWILTGKTLYVNKEKVLNYLRISTPIVEAQDSQELSAATKIVEEFENPTLSEKINIESIKPLNERIKETVTEQAASLGEAVEFVTAEQMPKGRGRAKGYYNPRTGKVVVKISAHKSVEDACRTVFHEIVGHKGLRAVMGERFDSFLDSVYKGMGWRVRSGIDREADKYIAKGESETEARRHATEEYVARMAEDGFNPRNVTVWTRIADILKNALMEAKIYLGFGLSNRDVRYALWKSYDMQIHKGAIAAARDVVMREKEGMIDDAEDNRYREAEDVVDRTLNEWYDNEVKAFGHRLREGYQDGMLALKKVQEQIAKQTGSPIEDYEDAYTAQNQAVSKSKEEQYWYKERFFKPMVDAVVALMSGANISYKEAIDYILSKSGIERNSTLAWRDAVEEYRTAEGRTEEGEAKTVEQIEEEIALIEQKEAEIRRTLNARYSGKMSPAYIASLDAEREKLIPGYTKYRKKDYSGLTSLTAEKGEEVTLQDAEKRAFEYVEEVEDRCEDLCSDLWDKINQATKATLRKSYTSGILSKAEYDKVRGMFQYYVPMRGWEEETAADVYDYITKGSGYAPTVRRAEGRKSVADDPIATIGNMADSAIIAGNKNLMKQKLLSLAINRPTSLFTVGGVWYVKDGKEWKESFPEIPDNATPEEVAQIIQAHEEEMQHRRAEGTARRKKEAPHLTRIATKKEQSQHAIRVKRGGVEYVVYVNGDPRIAQAINGELTKREKEGWKKAWEKLNRILAANFTTRNPSFVLRNLSRDIMFATTAVAVKEDEKYLRKFMENGGKNLNIWNLLRLYKAGKLNEDNEQHRYFKEFMENGGETGYTAINDVDAYKREIAGILAEAQGRTNFSELLGTYIEWSPNLGWAGTPVKGVETVVKFLGLMNRGAEDISRFTTYMTSRQMGRSVQQSIANAKDITVNFNRKGNGTMGADTFKLLYLFFNASIQGAHTLAKLIKRNPKKSIAAMATTGVIGVVMPMLNDVVYEIMGGDDEDGNMKYEDLPEWVRRNNICIKVGLDRWVTIPVSIELRPVYGIGDVAIQYAKGNIDGSSAAKDIVSQMMAVSPIDLTGGGYDLVANLVPDVIKPLAQAYTNKDYFGKPIYRDNGYNEAYPEYTKAYKSTNDVIVDMSKWLNDITGGDEVTPGMVDINPGVVEHIIEGYMGGLGKTISQMTKTVQMIGDEEKRMWRNVPVVNAFLTEAGDVSYRLNNLYFKYTDQADELSRREREYRKRVNEGQEAYMAKYEELVNSKDWEKVGIVKYYKKQVNKLYTAQKEYGDSKEIADMIVMLKAQMIDEVRQIDGK